LPPSCGADAAAAPYERATLSGHRAERQDVLPTVEAVEGEVKKSELVQQALAALRTGELERAKELVADGFVWHIPGSSVISGDAVGVEQWSEKLHRLLGAGLQPELLEMLEGETYVAAIQRNTADANGATLDVQVVNLFTVDGEKVNRLDTFFSDQASAETFWNAALG
jgi:uncharacterized protein